MNNTKHFNGTSGDRDNYYDQKDSYVPFVTIFFVLWIVAWCLCIYFDNIIQTLLCRDSRDNSYNNRRNTRMTRHRRQINDVELVPVEINNRNPINSLKTSYL